MADIEMDDAYTLTLSEDEDICASILARFSNSTREDHRHLCAAIGAMTQELKDENLPLTPVAYLGFTCSSLDGLSSQAEPSAHVIDALLTLLSIVFRKVSPAILVKKSEFLLELLARVLRSSSLTVGAALSGLKCISHLLIIRCRVNWSDVSSVYGFLLSFITDSRPKVRRQSSLCLRDVLQNFQGTPLLSPASEGVTNLFERFLLLAGGSNADAGEGPKGAQEVLYVLDALKECLFHISIKYKTAVLKYYKTLLALQQPLVTKRITDSLNILCLNPSTDVSPEVLLDLLCSLALSVSTNETSVDGMTVTARLLGNGMAKIYSLNRQICIVKLPIVFNALRDVLASEHEEAIHAAVHTFKTLIHACIDESLIKQGVDQIVMNANLDARKSGPTIIEKVCATIESLLGYHYAGVWDLAVQVVSVMFDKLGVYSSYFMRGALKILEEMAKLSNEDFPFRKQSTIGEFASIADTEAVSALFQSTMLKLLMVIKRARKAQSYRDCNSKRAQLFDLTVSLLPGLNADEINVLFGEIKSALQDDEGLIQKKAYKVLSIILRDCDRFLSSNSSKLKELPESSNSSKLKELPESSNSSKLKELPESSKSSKLDELVDIMIEVQPCHSSAKRHRLDCLYLLVAHVLKSDTKQRRDDIIRFLTEIVLALKEANKKTRNRAYDILIQIGHAYGDEEKGGKRDDLLEFFYMVAGGLAGETPHMISAAMKALARLAYEFSDLVSTASNLLPSTFLLLQRKNKEIIKANLGLLKVLVAKSQTEGLQLHLKSLVEGLLKWQDATKTHFKAKVKLLLEMLVRKCGLDAVKAVVPQEHIKLLNNIRKIKERKEWKLGSNSEEARSQVSKATASRLSRWNHKKVFSDFDDEETENSDTDYMDAKTVAGRRGKASSQLKSKASSLRRTNKNLLDQLEDEPLDLLDRQRTRSALRSFENLKRKMEWDDGPEIDSDGRLIIRDEAESYKKKPSEPDSDARSESGSYLSANSKKTQKRRKTSESGWATTGKEYGSKKAGGDLKRKDKLEPYAYWPLDRKMMSRRPEHRAAARKGISSVVKMTKRLEGKSVSSILSTKGLKFKNKSRVQKKGGSKRKSR
ncbi:uncharacterized protein LOC117631848 isoform X2 [Prunus dulcis]|uniref:uncharacterized protein LOC117631848 isoform X2 n=1 Tax=Prunus dulcis TaxID=3755 RepID=UPI00148292B4|nr:uncharacterized protein LOC117631848 isoform X2 [Prunus dulcis]